MPGERLRTDPETFRYELIREIEQMAKDAGKKGSSTAKIERQLAKIGQRLYKELFSADLRREYRSFSRQITTLQIISDEPWIPWELIKPYDDEGDEIVDDDFLCMQFDLARWFTPAQAPAPRSPSSSLACIAPGDSKLVEAAGRAGRPAPPGARSGPARPDAGSRDLRSRRRGPAGRRSARPSLAFRLPRQFRERSAGQIAVAAARPPPCSPRTISWAVPKPG